MEKRFTHAAMDHPAENDWPAEAPRTPPRPPYSPVTPVMSQATPFSISSSSQVVPPPVSSGFNTKENNNGGSGRNTAASFINEPAPVPISESDNPDAIALRSAISVLQIQKQQSLRDIHALDKLKQAALSDPESFARELAAGNINTKEGDVFNPTNLQDDEDEDDEGDNDMNSPADTRNEDSMDIDAENSAKMVNFGKIPKPQNVVRMPPINWAKYHIVGEPLDKLHEEQRARPTPGEPYLGAPSTRASEHFVAAPYRPFVDRIDPPMKTRSSNKAKK